MTLAGVTANPFHKLAGQTLIAAKYGRRLLFWRRRLLTYRNHIECLVFGDAVIGLICGQPPGQRTLLP